MGGNIHEYHLTKIWYYLLPIYHSFSLIRTLDTEKKAKLETPYYFQIFPNSAITSFTLHNINNHITISFYSLADSGGTASKHILREIFEFLSQLLL